MGRKEQIYRPVVRNTCIGNLKRLTSNLQSGDSSIQEQARHRLSKLTNEQRNPTVRFLNRYNPAFPRIYKDCPVSSHVRKANPRTGIKLEESIIFRRGYLSLKMNAFKIPKLDYYLSVFRKILAIFEQIKRNIESKNVENAKQSTENKYHPVDKEPTRISFNTTTLGGGYYFIPPIPNKKISEMGQIYFEQIR